MLLTQRIEEMDLPSAEKTAANYLLAQGSKLKGRSTRKIATDAYTTPATLVRLGQRLGYEGWTDFFEAFLEEREYLEEHFQNVDANRPFTQDDSQTAVANKIRRCTGKVSRIPCHFWTMRRLKKRWIACSAPGISILWL